MINLRISILFWQMLFFILVIPILFVNDSNPSQGFTWTNSTTPIFVLQKTYVSFPFVKIYPTPILVGKNLPIPILIGKNPVHILTAQINQ